MIKQRKCVGCGKLNHSGDMIKVTKNYTNGDIVINPGSFVFGRSAYLCYNHTCIENALKKNKLYRALKTNATFDKEILFSMLVEKKD